MNRENLKRIGIAIGIIILILLFLKCENNKYQQLKGEYGVLKEQYKTKKNEVVKIETERLKEKDSLNKENIILQNSQKESEQRIAELESRIKDDEAKGKKDSERIKNLSYSETAKEYNTIYQTNQAIATNNSVDLKGDLPVRVLTTVYEAVNCIQVSKKKDSVIVEQRSVITNSEKEKTNLNLQVISAEQEIEARKGLGELADKQIDNLEGQNKKLRNKNFGNKVLIAVGIIGGFLLGNSIAK